MLYAEGVLKLVQRSQFEDENGVTIVWYKNFIQLEGEQTKDESGSDVLEIGSKADFREFIDKPAVFTFSSQKVPNYTQFKLRLVKITPNQPE